jgi:hypothetical protein
MRKELEIASDAPDFCEDSFHFKVLANLHFERVTAFAALVIKHVLGSLVASTTSDFRVHEDTDGEPMDLSLFFLLCFRSAFQSILFSGTARLRRGFRR